MTDHIKPHRTVKITAARLRREGNCEDMIRAFRYMLPAVVSTDPEENLEVAARMWRGSPPLPPSYWARWIVLCGGMQQHGTADWVIVTGRGESSDEYLAAQYLAVYADRALSDKGR